jgi:phospholipase/carboxylesterase
MDKLEMIKLEPQGKANASVIWLHGLGADGNDFVPLVEALELPAKHGIRFLFPHAPIRAVTINGGMQMRAWFDITDISEDMNEDEAGVREAQTIIERVIENEIKAGIPAERILLAGFSQGGCMALHTGLRFRQGLAGILGLSCYLPLRRTIATEMQRSQLSTVIQLMHGLYDPVVNHALGKMTYELLRDLGLQVSWIEYAMDHTVCQQQLQDIREYIINRLHSD